MANSCITEITFTGSQEEIVKLHDEVLKSISGTGSSVSDSWLGNILIHVGLSNLIDNSENMVLCRGCIVDVGDVEGEGFYIVTETAWEPMLKMWYVVIKALGLSTINFCAVSEAPESDFYQIYDPCGLGIYDSSQVYVNVISGNPDLDRLSGYYIISEFEELIMSFLKLDHSQINSEYSESEYVQYPEEQRFSRFLVEKLNQAFPESEGYEICIGFYEKTTELQE